MARQYEKHIENVLTYFTKHNRMDDLLIINLKTESQKDSFRAQWDEITTFLGCPPIVFDWRSYSWPVEWQQYWNCTHDCHMIHTDLMPTPRRFDGKRWVINYFSCWCIRFESHTRCYDLHNFTNSLQCVHILKVWISSIYIRQYAFIAGGGGVGGEGFFVRPPDHAVVTSNEGMLWSQVHVGRQHLFLLLALSLIGVIMQLFLWI